MKYRPLLGDAMSGSMGGVVASHNRGGTYFRQRATPVNPGSVFQDLVRQIMAALTSLWNETLTEPQRQSWDDYALNVPLADKLGDPRNVGGIAMYVRSNVPRIQAGLPRVDTGPSIFNLGSFTAPVITSITAPTALSLEFTNTDEWANEDDAAMIIYGGRGQSQSINYFKGPYRFADTILGDGITPPTSPAAIVLPFTLQTGQKGFIKYSITRADGRLSGSFRDFDTVI
jgi:hypothetical protein